MADRLAYYFGMGPVLYNDAELLRDPAFPSNETVAPVNLTGGPLARGADYLNVKERYEVAGKQVVGPQRPPISDLNTTTATVTDVATKVNEILAALRAHGLIAT
ncbi:MAG: hypothetical protein KatS3mg015_2767 [Fimbriimonadales bacterium]|nr:MAG: hypothetical protein KatS3mg015_2767 [Fimbriimonadales bacterium]